MELASAPLTGTIEGKDEGNVLRGHKVSRSLLRLIAQIDSSPLGGHPQPERVRGSKGALPSDS